MSVGRGLYTFGGESVRSWGKGVGNVGTERVGHVGWMGWDMFVERLCHVRVWCVTCLEEWVGYVEEGV